MGPGTFLRVRGHWPEWTATHRTALAAATRLGDADAQARSGFGHYEAKALTHLGDAHQAAGELAQAQDAWQQALAILEDLRHPDADQVRAKLACVDQQATEAR